MFYLSAVVFLLAVAATSSMLRTWYEVKRDIRRDRKPVYWQHYELPLSAGSRPYRGKSMVR